MIAAAFLVPFGIVVYVALGFRRRAITAERLNRAASGALAINEGLMKAVANWIGIAQAAQAQVRAYQDRDRHEAYLDERIWENIRDRMQVKPSPTWRHFDGSPADVVSRVIAESQQS